MGLPREQREILRRLMSALSDGQLTDSEARQLSNILRDDSEARRLYLDHVMMEALLRREAGREAGSASLKGLEPIRDRQPQHGVGGKSVPTVKPVFRAATKNAARRKRFAVVSISAAIAAIFIATLVSYWLAARDGDGGAARKHRVLSGTVTVPSELLNTAQECGALRRQ